MQILVLNGSPKGEYSITLQTVRYLEILHPEHTFEVLHVGQTIRAMEKDFSSAAGALARAELIVFSYPVYTFVAPSQLHRFVELVKQHDIDLSGKWATQISTSKHFYDITAHRYIEENCADLGMKIVRGLSADMDDLTTEQGQRQARDFFDYVVWSVENGIAEPKPAKIEKRMPIPATQAKGREKSEGDVLILTDCEEGNTRLQAMIERFQGVIGLKTRVINIREYPLKGGCLGCFRCAVTGKCVYKDGFDEFLRGTIQTAQAIVYAFTIRDHSMGARFKMYDDRNFCNGHRTVTMGMPIGYLVDGPYAQEENVRTIVEARAQVGGNFLAGVATNEADTDAQIDILARKIEYALENKYVPPQNFYGVGGMKVFRDLIWLMQGMMRADHKFYKQHGQYDFPQKHWPRMLMMYLVGAMLSSPKILSNMGNKMNEGMIAPYKKALDSARKMRKESKEQKKAA